MSNYNAIDFNAGAIEELTLTEQEKVQGGGLGSAIVRAGKWAYKNKGTIALTAYEIYDAVVGDD